jgi:hypothetical protein
MNHYFNEWYKEQDTLGLCTVREAAEMAWFDRQEIIECLEDQVDGLENELHCVRAYNDELVAKVEWLQSVINNAMLPEGYELKIKEAEL